MDVNPQNGAATLSGVGAAAEPTVSELISQLEACRKELEAEKRQHADTDRVCQEFASLYYAMEAKYGTLDKPIHYA